MIDVVIVDFGSADRIDEFLLQHCALDEIAQQALHFLLVGERSIHFVRFLLQRSHLALDRLQVILEIV